MTTSSIIPIPPVCGAFRRKFTDSGSCPYQKTLFSKPYLERMKNGTQELKPVD